jgi:hypothetical protein
MAWVTFTADYNHRWPSRAVTFFPSGYTGSVKREVEEAAIAKGVATPAKKPSKAVDDEQVSEGVERVTVLDGGDSAVDGDAPLAAPLD